MFPRSLIRTAVFRRAQSTAPASAPPVRRVGLGSAAAVAGALAVGWYGGTHYFRPEKKAASPVTPAGFPDIELQRDYPFRFLSPPTPSEVTGILTKKSWSFTETGVPGASRCDGVQLPSNGQIEDRYVYGKIPSPFATGEKPADDWLAAGVFDGHCGSHTSEALSKSLVAYVHASLGQLTQPATDADVDKAIQQAFLALDDVFIQSARTALEDGQDASFADKVLRLSPGTNGSCALLALFDPATRTLRVACTGDSRGVLGVQSSTEGSTWNIVALSVDQKVSNPAELARIAAEHPGEEQSTLVRGHYYMDLEPTRTFGDGRQKWPLAIFDGIRTRFNADYYGGRRPWKPEVFRSPPYHTARPEVTTVRLEPGKRAFMVVATDGLWDTMGSEQAVGLVGRWEEWVKAGRPAVKDGERPDFGAYDLGRAEDAPQFEEKKTTVQDDNAAVHLLRNALGGAHHDMVSGLLAFKPPFSRYVRDDITVQVVFFDA